MKTIKKDIGGYGVVQYNSANPDYNEQATLSIMDAGANEVYFSLERARILLTVLTEVLDKVDGK